MKKMRIFTLVIFTALVLSSCEVRQGKHNYANEVLDALLESVNSHDFSKIEPYFCDMVRNSSRDLEEEFNGIYDYLKYIELSLPITEDDIDLRGIGYEHNEYNEGEIRYIVPYIIIDRDDRITYIYVFSFYEYPAPEKVGVLGFAIKEITEYWKTYDDRDKIIYQVGEGSTFSSRERMGNYNYPPLKTLPND